MRPQTPTNPAVGGGLDAAPVGECRVERSFLTDDLEFHQVEDLPTAIGELEQALAAWNHISEEIRPHQALGYLTPNAFYARWLTERGFPGQTQVSDIS